MSTLRLAVVTDALLPFNHGGKEERYDQITRGLARRDVDVHVYTMKWWTAPERTMRLEDQLTLHAICPKLPLYSGDRRSMWQAAVFAVCCLRLMFARFDVLETDAIPYLQLFVLRLVVMLRRKRLVVTWYEVWGREYWREYLGPLGLVAWTIERVAMALPHRLVAISPDTAERLHRFRASADVIPTRCGVNAAHCAELPAHQDKVDVITVGRLLPNKRIDLLLKAIAHLRDEGRSLRVDIIGRGPEAEHLGTLTADLGITDLVTFRADIEDHDEVLARVRAARVFAFPSEREGFGIAALEALACGTPVVTTDAPDNAARSLVADSGYGRVCARDTVAFAAGILAELDQSRDPQSDRDRAAWLKSYSWDSITSVVEEVLRCA